MMDRKTYMEQYRREHIEERRAYDRQRYLELGEEYRERASRRRITYGAEFNAKRRADTAARLALLPARVDESAFDTITEHSAYWAGMLMADGCVCGHDVRLALHADDVEHVAAFGRFLKLGRTPLMSQCRTVKGISPRATISVKSKRLAAALAALGITPRKSLTASAAESLCGNRHFWRGVIDGDGCVRLIQRNNLRDYPSLQCLGSRMLMHQFAAYISSLLNGKFIRVSPRENIYHFTVSGSFAVPVIRELYGDCTVALARKAAIAAKAMTRTFANAA